MKKLKLIMAALLANLCICGTPIDLGNIPDHFACGPGGTGGWLDIGCGIQFDDNPFRGD